MIDHKSYIVILRRIYSTHDIRTTIMKSYDRPSIREVSWRINCCDDVRGWCYEHPGQSSLPHSGEWLIAGEVALRVQRCIEVGDEVRVVDLREVPWCQCPGGKLQLRLGQSFTVAALRGEWFQARSRAKRVRFWRFLVGEMSWRSGQWGPLCAVELSQDASDASGFDEDWICPEVGSSQRS